MIFESLKYADGLGHFGNAFVKAIEFLRRSDLAALADGKYPIDGDKVFAVIQGYVTRARQDCKWEAHRKYIDIQHIVAGEEGFGYAPVDQIKIKTEYNPEKDIAFYEGDSSVIPVSAGSLVVFFPHDAHQPGIAVNNPMPIRKVVVKIAVQQ